MEETTKKKPAKRPTPRQRKAALEIVKNLLKDKPETEAKVLADIGYSKGITETPSMVTQSEGFQTALEETGLKAALIRQGITPDKISERINVLLHAKKSIQKFSHETGETELIGEQDDYQAIDKGLSHATKIYGILDETPKSPTGNTYNFIFSEDIRNKVNAIDAEIKEALIKPHVPIT